ncbi:type VI secretion system protein TssA [Larsenimonas suaedae]|uniref:Type VI secretion system protein TssA n=1 Tax=Larsenimonas suaedae TaxID=1851019 RepID=A0ABU1GVM7_9GAMM|nr:type VI secretion system protein TssA [Larsenimonas suaedae]MCM2973211.1 type VI secretion system protein TssA [Larsenimonas suaedae]MDR5896104.1 type VI secretion system protein TssA [Larsenimonas suaedae]
MKAIEDHAYVERVLAPLGDPPAGERLEDDPDYDFLDAQMMKLGTMQHQEIDFAKVESTAVMLLETRSKDLKVLSHLLYCLQREHSGERFALSLLLLNRALEQFWETAWPFKGPKGKRGRARLFTQVMQRASQDVEALDFNPSIGDGVGFALEQLTALEAHAEAHGLPDDEFGTLLRALNTKARETAPAEPTQTADAHAEQSAAAPAAAPAQAAPAQPSAASTQAQPALDVSLSGGNERANRQALLKVADHLNEASVSDPLGYRLRRHAVWASITSLPLTKDGVKTELMAVSRDRVADYEDALAKGADLELWHKIEASLAASPYWLDGHALSAQAAMQLGHTRCAEAIADEVRLFLDRLEGIEALTFKDGTPFLSDDTRYWLDQQGAKKGGSAGGSGDAWFDALDTAEGLLESDGVAPALALLEDGLKTAKSPRAQFYWRLVMAELMVSAGFGVMASHQFETLARELEGVALDQWEPDLLERIEKARDRAARERS